MRKSPIILCTLTFGVVAGIAALVCAFVVDAPSVSPDEWGYLLNGQVLLGRHEVFLPFAKFYGPLFGLFSAVGALVTGSLHGAYRFDLIANVILAMAVAALCVWIAQHVLDATREVALLAGLVVFVSPGGFDGALFAWAESLSRLVVVSLVMLVCQATREPNTRRLVTLAVVAGLAPFVHGRFVSVIASMLVLFSVWAIGRHVRATSVGFATLTMVSVYAAGRVFSSVVRGWLYRGSGAQEMRLIRRVFQPNLWTDIVRETGGQIWYALAASAGLALVAVVWMARQSLGRPRRIINAGRSDVGAMSLFMMTMGSLIVALGALQLARAERGDQFIYGRHVEAFLPLFLTIGVVEVARLHKKVHKTWLIGALSIIGISVIYSVSQRQDIVRQWVNLNGPLKTANILAVDAMADLVGKEGLISLGIGFTVIASIVVLAHWRIGSWAILGLALLFFTSSVYTARTTMVERSWMHRTIGTTSELIAPSREVTIGYDGKTLHDKRYFALRYSIHPAQLQWLDVVNGNLIVPESINCVYGFPDRFPAVGQWKIGDREDGIDRVLWMRSSVDHC